MIRRSRAERLCNKLHNAASDRREDPVLSFDERGRGEARRFVGRDGLDDARERQLCASLPDASARSMKARTFAGTNGWLG